MMVDCALFAAELFLFLKREESNFKGQPTTTNFTKYLELSFPRVNDIILY